MVFAVCERVVVTQDIPKVKVLSGQSISMESRGADSSLRLTFLVSAANYPLMFYFLRYFRGGSSHRVTGTLNVSAYSFDNSNKAFASVRVGVNQVSPIREVDADGRLVGAELADGCVAVNDDSFPTSKEYRKCRFIVMKYVWDNWSNDKLVDGKKDSLREAFSDNLEDLYEDLVDLDLIPNRFNPISVQEVTVKRLKKNNSSSRTARKVAVRVPNPAVRTSDMLSPHLILTELANDEIRFNDRLFSIPPSPPLNQQETANNNEDTNMLLRMSPATSEGSTASNREQMRQFMNRFRGQENSLMSFPQSQREQIIKFQQFIFQRPDGACSVCLKKLYPEERRYRTIDNLDSLNCHRRNFTPLTKVERRSTKYMVCLEHLREMETKFPIYIYPGDVLQETKSLNYRERCAISPIKLMTQITRKSNSKKGVIGHYEVSGAIGVKHNFEFAEMAYVSTLGLYYRRGDPQIINKRKVTAAYEALKNVHPLLRRYELAPLMRSLEKMAQVGLISDWHYSMATPNEENTSKDESHGGIAKATVYGETLKGYTRQSCDDFSDNIAAATGTEYPWEDPVLFANHFRRKWNYFFEKHVLGHFARQIGGIKDYSWVLETQDRGSPHFHVCLWTVKSVEELIPLNLVSCRLYPGEFSNDPLMHRLVLKHQIHRCQESYCKLHITGKCRFGYPKDAAPRTEFVEDFCIYERTVADMNVNAYNPYLLACWRANMDIQYNKGEAAVRYLAKYMAKNESDAVFEIINKGSSGNYRIRNEKTTKEHFKSRIVGAVEAIYDIMGWHKHQTSRGVTFIQTNLPGDERRLIKPNIKEIDRNDHKIFTRTHVEKYEQRTGGRDLNISQFYCFYRELTPSPEGDRSNGGLFQRDFYPEPLPLYIFSERTRYGLRKKQAFWRTFPQSEVNGEKYYYQQIVLNKVIFGSTFIIEKGSFPLWRDYFEFLVSLGPANGGISVNRSYNINNLADISDFERGIEVTQSELSVMYSNANDSQKSIFNRVNIELINNSVTFVSGAAGT
ncbi:hypothetical protein [Parasitella parasitica]|uniref:Helitron helicase-like domain-containing protein n=1 Tax=Parasitella parasitica TaxID=35722 RepID=A0A0B7N053_9FUNG|nr:hypothetical protein [Parasitella parasitica]